MNTFYIPEKRESGFSFDLFSAFSALGEMWPILNVNVAALFLFVCDRTADKIPRVAGDDRHGSWCSDFSFVRYPVMIILASKPQIWPCFAMGSCISGDRAALPGLRSLSVDKLVGSDCQVHGTEDILSAVTGGQQGSERGEKGQLLSLGEDRSGFASK